MMPRFYRSCLSLALLAVFILSGSSTLLRAQEPPPLDTDGDGLSDEEEIALGTDPTLPDTDHDGFTDWEEVRDGTDPLTPGGRGTGLRGEYYNNRNFTSLVGVRTDPVINFNWGTGQPFPGVGSDTFSVRWTGFLQPLYSETWRIYTVSDDGIRVWIDDVLVVNDWSDHAARERSGTIALEAGRLYSLRVDFYDNRVHAVARLSWSSASQPKQTIPQRQLYTPELDVDGDGITDALDNCPLVPNPDQLDSDGNGAGDACDGDDDGDGIDDGADNCPRTPNPGQEDLDGDGVGDVCDGDTDGDGLDDLLDNCPLTPNPGQEDLDSDGVGDLCDPDVDGDGIEDGADNCPLAANPAQADLDGDGLGDLCDPDDDGDGVEDGADNCPREVNPGQEDLDGDGVGDLCDPDVDGDGVEDGADNCPLAANPGQADLDGDGLGDVCDPDDDGDGFEDGSDNCPRDANPGQEDLDGDGLGDLCDADVDGDGVDNDTDNCPETPNPGQEDRDGDLIGDVCEPGPPSPFTTEIHLTPPLAAADGEDPILLSVRVRAEDGRVMNFTPVTLTTTNPHLTVDPTAGETDFDGFFTARITSPVATAGVIEVRAEDVRVGSPIAEFDVGDPALSIRGLATVLAGQSIVYRLDVSNPGRLPSDFLTLSAGLAFGQVFFEEERHPADASLVSQFPHQVTWSFDSLAPGEVKSFHLVGRVAGNVPIRSRLALSALVTASEDADLSNNEATFSTEVVVAEGPTGVVQAGKLAVEYTAATPQVHVGETATLEVWITNATATETLYNAEAFADLAGVIPTLSPEWPDPAHPGRLLPAQTAVARFPVRITADFPDLSRTHPRAWATADDSDPGDGSFVSAFDLLDETDLAVDGPGLQLAVIPQPGQVLIGETVTFEVRLHNHPNRNDSAVELTARSLLTGEMLVFDPPGPLLPGGTATATFLWSTTVADVPEVLAPVDAGGRGELYPEAVQALSARGSARVEPPQGGGGDPALANLGAALDPPGSALPGFELSLPLRVLASGGEAAAESRLRLTLPPAVEVLGSDPAGVYEPALRRLSWELGSLGPGTTTAIGVALRVAAGTEVGTTLLFDAVVSTSSAESDYGDNTAHLEVPVVARMPGGATVFQAVSRDWVVADGRDRIELRLGAVDQLGNLLAGSPVTFLADQPGTILEPPAGMTDAFGQLRLMVGATAEGPVTITAELGQGLSRAVVLSRRPNAVAIDPPLLAVGVGGRGSLDIRALNTSADGDLFDLTAVGLEALDPAWYHFEPQPLALGPGQQSHGRLVVEIPAAQCAAAGTYAVTVGAVGRNLGPIGQADATVRVTAAPPQLTGVLPAAGAQIGSGEVLFSWRSNTPGTATVFLRAVGEADYLPHLLAPHPDDPTLWTLALSLTAGSWQWYGEMATECGLARVGTAASPRSFQIVQAVRFADRTYSFEIRDDYDQTTDADGRPLAIRLRNDDAVDRRVIVDVDTPYPDLIIGFTGSGSVDQAAVLRPGEVRTLTLRAFTQEIERQEYGLTLTLTSEGVTDSVPLTIRIRPPRFDVRYQLLAVDPETRIHRARLTNFGDTVTDLDFDLFAATSGLPARAIVEPDLHHVYLPAGSSLSFEIIPLELGEVPGARVLGPRRLAAIARTLPAGSRPMNPSRRAATPSYNGQACAGGACRDLGDVADPTCPAGTVPFDMPLPSPTTLERSSSSWYCTNKPNIDVGFDIPFLGSGAEVTGARISASFSGSGIYQHTTQLGLNGTPLATGTVPSQSSLSATVPLSSWVGMTGTSQTGNVRSVHPSKNQAHYVVATNFKLSVTVEAGRELRCVPDIPDTDGDGVKDDIDNCVDIPNPDQRDSDGDGRGDACDDSDGDGAPDGLDNCPGLPNPSQADGDGDGIGDACEADGDLDGIIDDLDNCPAFPNPGQEDDDGDGQGNPCDGDRDGDGVANVDDNCPRDPNPDQADGDGDGIGDVCDDDESGVGGETPLEHCLVHFPADSVTLYQGPSLSHAVVETLTRAETQQRLLVVNAEAIRPDALCYTRDELDRCLDATSWLRVESVDGGHDTGVCRAPGDGVAWVPNEGLRTANFGQCFPNVDMSTDPFCDGLFSLPVELTGCQLPLATGETVLDNLPPDGTAGEPLAAPGFGKLLGEAVYDPRFTTHLADTTTVSDEQGRIKLWYPIEYPFGSLLAFETWNGEALPDPGGDAGGGGGRPTGWAHRSTTASGAFPVAGTACSLYVRPPVHPAVCQVSNPGGAPVYLRTAIGGGAVGILYVDDPRTFEAAPVDPARPRSWFERDGDRRIWYRVRWRNGLAAGSPEVTGWVPAAQVEVSQTECAAAGMLPDPGDPFDNGQCQAIFDARVDELNVRNVPLGEDGSTVLEALGRGQTERFPVAVSPTARDIARQDAANPGVDRWVEIETADQTLRGWVKLACLTGSADPCLLPVRGNCQGLITPPGGQDCTLSTLSGGVQAFTDARLLTPLGLMTPGVEYPVESTAVWLTNGWFVMSNVQFHQTVALHLGDPGGSRTFPNGTDLDAIVDELCGGVGGCGIEREVAQIFLDVEKGWVDRRQAQLRGSCASVGQVGGELFGLPGIMPVPAPIVQNSHPARESDSQFTRNDHWAWDFDVEAPTPLVALGDGVIEVTECRFNQDQHANPPGLVAAGADRLGGYGNFVLVRYPMAEMPVGFQQSFSAYNHVYVLYAHLMPCGPDSAHPVPQCFFDSYGSWVRQGDACDGPVTRGQALGAVDNSGAWTSGDHLHLEVWVAQSAPLSAGPYSGGKKRICPQLLFGSTPYRTTDGKPLCEFLEGEDLYTLH